MNSKEKIAKVIRVISIPPIMIISLIVILLFMKPGIFKNGWEAAWLIFFLGIVPVLAYPLQEILPKYKETGRKGQRKLAFIFSLIGYTCAFALAIFLRTTAQIRLICTTYFLSVILLTICNKGFHFRASGHACSFTGPLVLLSYFEGWRMAIPCIIFAAVIIWSSLTLKRHTKTELVAGIVVCLASFGISLQLSCSINGFR